MSSDNSPKDNPETKSEGDIKNRRRQRRRTLNSVVDIVNSITGEQMGRVVNVTTEGLMLVSNTPMNSDTLYQVMLKFSQDIDGVSEIQLGMDCLWTSPTTPDADMYWSGCHIIDIDETMLQHLQILIEQLGD